MTTVCSVLTYQHRESNNSNLFLSHPPQQRTRRHSRQPAPTAGRVRGDPAAGGHPLAQRARERRPADLGVHPAAAARSRSRAGPCRGEAQLFREGHFQNRDRDDISYTVNLFFFLNKVINSAFTCFHICFLLVIHVVDAAPRLEIKGLKLLPLQVGGHWFTRSPGPGLTSVQSSPCWI